MYYIVLINMFVCPLLIGAIQVDDGAYSEPVMALNMYKKWSSMNHREQKTWASKANINIPKMVEFVSSVNTLMKIMNKPTRGAEDHQHYPIADELNITTVITKKKLNMCRLILTLMSHKNIIRQSQKKQDLKAENFLLFSGMRSKMKICDELLNDLLPPYRELSIKQSKGNREEDSELKNIPWEISSNGTYVFW